MGKEVLKPQFLNELEISTLPDTENIWFLVSHLAYNSSYLSETIDVPAGFVTDLASVPRVPIAYQLWGNRAHREAVIHDFLYQTHMTSKSIADKIFLEAMKVRGKPAHVRYPMYWGVVLGGKKSYSTGKERYRVLQSIDK